MLKLRNARKQEALILATLKALEQVGDEAAVPYVEQLALANPKSPAQYRIRESARECLPYLRSGAAQRQGSQTLLRASSSDAGQQTNVLLRPAVNVSTVEEAQLLRGASE